jgi:hypothetical protein
MNLTIVLITFAVVVAAWAIMSRVTWNGAVGGIEQSADLVEGQGRVDSGESESPSYTP